MSQTIKQYKQEKEELENKIAALLADFCDKYEATLRSIEWSRIPLYSEGSSLWDGKGIGLRFRL